MSKVYTKKGDNGNTKLLNGCSISKNSIYSESLGCLDELNSELGFCVAIFKLDEIDIEQEKILENIQILLFKIGSVIASPSSNDIKFDEDEKHTNNLEIIIDKLTEKLPKLTNFIIPGGNLTIASIHKARTICRRTERNIVNISEHSTNPYILNCMKFINRLSDYLFTLARYLHLLYKVNEIQVKKDIIVNLI